MTPSKRSFENRLEDLDADTDTDETTDAVGVEWRDASPDERPDGMEWTPSTDEVEDQEDARLTFDVWMAQRETLETVRTGDHDVVAFLGGYGTGKSVLGARWLLANALENPGSKFLAMGQDFKKARDTTFTKLFAQLPGERTTLTTSGFNGPENSPLVEDYNRQQHRLTLCNDTVVVLGSADRYNRYAGAEFGAAWLDEPSHYGEDLHELTGMVTTRLRGVDGPKTQLWTLTGEGYNAAWEILEKRQNADGEPIGLDVEVVTASVLENPYLTEGDKQRFRRKYEGTSKEQQALHGGFAAATGLVYSKFSRDTHVIPAREARDRTLEDWRIYGYDAGWKDPRVLLEIGKTAYDQYIVLDEFVESGTHVEDAIRWLSETDKPNGTIYAEHEPADIRKFNRSGFKAQKAEKSIDAGISEVRKRLESDGNITPDAVDTSPNLRRKEHSGPVMGSFGDTPASNRTTTTRSSRTTGRDDDEEDEVEDEPEDEGTDERDTEPRVGLLVSDNCQHLIREFLGYKEDHVGTSQATDHALDALRYAVFTHGSRPKKRTDTNRSGLI
jgi:hypothetical protein